MGWSTGAGEVEKRFVMCEFLLLRDKFAARERTDAFAGSCFLASRSIDAYRFPRISSRWPIMASPSTLHPQNLDAGKGTFVEALPLDLGKDLPILRTHWNGRR